MHLSMILDPDTCMYDAYIYVPDPWLWCMCVWCTYLRSSILDSDACVYDAHIYDTGPWSWSMHVCMVHVSMMRLKFCHEPTNEQGDSRSRMVCVRSFECLCVSVTTPTYSQFGEHKCQVRPHARQCYLESVATTINSIDWQLLQLLPSSRDGLGLDKWTSFLPPSSAEVCAKLFGRKPLLVFSNPSLT